MFHVNPWGNPANSSHKPQSPNWIGAGCWSHTTPGPNAISLAPETLLFFQLQKHGFPYVQNLTARPPLWTPPYFFSTSPKWSGTWLIAARAMSRPSRDPLTDWLNVHVFSGSSFINLLGCGSKQKHQWKNVVWYIINTVFLIVGGKTYVTNPPNTVQFHLIAGNWGVPGIFVEGHLTLYCIRYLL